MKTAPTVRDFSSQMPKSQFEESIKKQCAAVSTALWLALLTTFAEQVDKK